MAVRVGPFGVHGEVPFDDGIHPSITKLQIHYGEGFVSLQTTYTNPNSNGQNVLTPVHGNRADENIETVTVNLAEGEYLTSLSGHYHNDGPNPAVHSLAFQSNTNPYGPYGARRPNEIPFIIPAPPTSTGRIVGFFGASDEYLNSIGASFELKLPHP